MLSPCAEPAPIRSPSNAQAIRVSSDAPAPTSALTATAAATALAALPPRPLDSGRPLRIVKLTPRRSPTQSSSACAATPAVFRDASRVSRPASPEIPAMVTPPLGDKAAVTMSPGSCSANPSTSKPHATFDTVAGAKAVTAFMERSYYFGRRTRPCVRPQRAELRPVGAPVQGALASPVIPLPDGRDQVVVKRALEIVVRREAPVGARRGVVDGGRPRIDDPLALRVDLEADRRIRERARHLVADLFRRRVERRQIVGGARQPLARRS